MSSTSPIGIFDSGIGGLTVFRAMRLLLPQESLCYLGDTARVPYGNKSAQTIIDYSRQNAAWLVTQGVKAVVVACNTSSAVALPALQHQLPVPVIGMIAPGAAAAAKASATGHIGIIGTARTIQSGAYETALRALRPDLHLQSIACPLFVSVVEEGWLDTDVTRQIVAKYLEPFKDKIDTLILGCTHYPLLRPLIQDFLGPAVQLIDSGAAAAETVAQELQRYQLLAPQTQVPQYGCYVTDMPAPFADVAKRFLGGVLPQIHHVQLT